jgi:hypothetical protein
MLCIYGSTSQVQRPALGFAQIAAAATGAPPWCPSIQCQVCP